MRTLCQRKMIFGYFIQVPSKLKSGFKTTLCFICVAAESAESLLSQLLSKSFTARSGWERAAQINFWKVHCPALLCRDGWKTRTPLLLPTKLLLPSKRIKLFPFSVCRGKLSCSKMTGNDCDASSRAQPQLLRTWHFLWVLQLCTLVHLAKDVKWIVCANVIPWYGNRETKQNFIVSRSPIVARFLIVVLGDDKLYSNIWVDRVIPKHFNHMTFFSVRLM